MNLTRAGYLYEQNLKGKSYAAKTIKRYSGEINQFFMFVRDTLSKNDITEIDRFDIMQYQKHIYEAAKPGKKEKRYSRETQCGIMFNLRSLFNYLCRNEYLLLNPFDGVELKKNKRQKQRQTIRVEDMNRFLDSIDGSTFTDLRDRAMFEMFYGTGLRISELTGLNMTDLDLNISRIFVRKGKGKVQRMLPAGRTVLERIKIYLKHGRPIHAKRGNQAVFITVRGQRIKGDRINQILKKRLMDLNLYKKGISAHVIRHSFATHLLENGASVKHVKELLGHKSLETTVIYTHFTINSLKRIMKMYHPLENELYEELKITEQEVRELKD